MDYYVILNQLLAVSRTTTFLSTAVLLPSTQACHLVAKNCHFSDLILVFDLTVRHVFVSKCLSREGAHWQVCKLTSNFVF